MNSASCIIARKIVTTKPSRLSSISKFSSSSAIASKFDTVASKSYSKSKIRNVRGCKAPCGRGEGDMMKAMTTFVKSCDQYKEATEIVRKDCIALNI
ncbi:hypothetical protein PVAND_002079 [Polypedilum vanderplanki]|uniref:Uncharacterized protein n=1 Tax=Polypedilum vanderplanki TaxID=319348 RepID=A0A9J6BRA7_POLVA|nr:hypothetical protein PVAND_002079 [Polypedilum vanderplanki]